MSRIAGIRVAGIASAVPARRVAWQDAGAAFGDEAARIAESTGIAARHVAGPGLTASDLGEAAARRLLDELGWPAESLDLLVLVTQTPDHFLPASAHGLHARLGLARQARVFDLTLGCSGFVYGLWLVSSLIVSGQARRALLVVADTISRTVDPADRATALLFGDAGTATAIEAGGHEDMTFALGSDGQGAPHLRIPGGGFRAPGDPARLHMDGAEVFSFTLREVPAAAAAALAERGWTMEHIDHVVLHQANRFLLQHLAKKLKVPEDKLVLALAEHGNTSGASIPLALSLALSGELRARRVRLLLAGFGVGWSWGVVALALGPMAMPAVVEIAEPAR